MKKIINPNYAVLAETAIKNGRARLSRHGALVVDTRPFTGRAVKNRFIIKDPEINSKIAWGETNQAIETDLGRRIIEKLKEKLNGIDTYVWNGAVGPFDLELNSPSAWHVMFAQNMFRKNPLDALAKQLKNHAPIKIFHDPYGKVSDLGIKHELETLILLDAEKGEVAIIGTAYAGEIKKSAFTMCNFRLPEEGILPMHASANCFVDGKNSSVLFGLSGTGKTTLSAVADRALIGDDEIIWSHTGLSNLENGCYAKLIKLNPKSEPEIFKAVHRFGAILENVVMDPESRSINFDDDSFTENTRGSYELKAIENVFKQDIESSAPKSIVFLMADAFGAMPPVARLNSLQAQYYFLAGYTAKVAGTELGIKEPKAAFSTCFGAPFMPRHASDYAKLLAKKAKESGASVWLLNTGWMNGGYGKAERYSIQVSRSLLKAIQTGEMDKQTFKKHPIFGFEVPESCPGVESSLFSLENSCGDVQKKLASKFIENARAFQNSTSVDVFSLGGPQI